MNTLSHRNPLYKIVTVHYLLASIFFLALAIMLFFSFEALTGHYFQPKTLALTHTAALGWGTIIIFGALYQLLPVILETELYSLKLSWLSLTSLVSGIVPLVYAFWIFDPGLYMQIGSLMVLIGILLFAVNVFVTIKHKKKDTIFQEFITTSCIWLTLTALLGTLMVFNFRFSFLQKDHLQLLRLHAHMGIMGWFLLLIIGVSAKLIPMFLVSKYQKRNLLWLSYYFINAALLSFLVDGYLNGLGMSTLMITLVGALGISFYLLYIYRCFISRVRKELDLPMIKSLFSFVFLTAGISALPFILYYHLKNSPFAINLSMLYGMLIFMGWISTLALGQTFKTLPFIIWLKHYGHLSGKVRTPVPADLINKLLLYIQVTAFIFFLTTFTTGFIANSPVLKLIGVCSLILTSLTYCTHIICLLLHKTKTQDYDKI